MAKQVKVFIGLPGSGKSYHLSNYSNQWQEDHVIFDDLDEDVFDLFVYNLGKGNSMIISDPWLCDAKNRKCMEEIFQKEGYDVEVFFFENSPEKCLKNIEYRNDGRNIKTFNAFNYTIPDDVEAIKIWQP